MKKIKVVYICHFSTKRIRQHLSLKSFRVGNLLRKIWRKPPLMYNDFGVWNADFIEAFVNNTNYECHVISHHLGMVKKNQYFSLNGISFHFIQEKENLTCKIIDTICKRNHKQELEAPAQRIKKVVEAIQPDIVVVCGAENPIYSSSVLMINKLPVFVILQTLLNDSKRIGMGIGNALRRELEKKIFATAGYFGTLNLSEKEFILEQNPQATCLKIIFPSSCPEEHEDVSKEFDFVFFANGLSRNKGVEDALSAFATVVSHHPSATLNIIGNCSEEYKNRLINIIEENGMSNNVTFHGHFPSRNDLIKQVKKARIAVLPGITALLNSTVREVMMLGIPAVVYETSATNVINANSQNLLVAKMENITDLGGKLLFAYEHPQEMTEMARRAQQYAQSTFTVEAVARTLDADIMAIVNNYYHQTPIPEVLKL